MSNKCGTSRKLVQWAPKFSIHVYHATSFTFLILGYDIMLILKCPSEVYT